MKDRENDWWAPVRKGLVVDPKHYKAIGPAIFLLLYLIVSADWKTGRLHRKIETISSETGIPIRTVKNHLRRLKKRRYIEITRYPRHIGIQVLKWRVVSDLRRENIFPSTSDSNYGPEQSRRENNFLSKDTVWEECTQTDDPEPPRRENIFPSEQEETKSEGKIFTKREKNFTSANGSSDVIDPPRRENNFPSIITQNLKTKDKKKKINKKKEKDFFKHDDSTSSNGLRPKKINDSHNQAIEEIISYLNEKLGTSYKPTSKNTVRHIRARIGEGFSVEDFKRVIDGQCSEWLNNTEMCRYLTPETLFSQKFEKYLQNAKVKKKPRVAL